MHTHCQQDNATTQRVYIAQAYSFCQDTCKKRAWHRKWTTTHST